eukprot:359061-Chlamydomonas_euryale.AAC.1
MPGESAGYHHSAHGWWAVPSAACGRIRAVQRGAPCAGRAQGTTTAPTAAGPSRRPPVAAWERCARMCET